MLWRKISMKTIEIRRADAGRIYDAWSKSKLMDCRGVLFSKFIISNMERIYKVIKEEEEYKKEQETKRGILSDKYLQAEKDLIDKYCPKNEKGEYTIKDGSYFIPKDKIQEFIKDKENLVNVEDIKDDAKRNLEFINNMTKYTNDIIKINLKTINLNKLSEDITPNLFRLIEELVE